MKNIPLLNDFNGHDWDSPEELTRQKQIEIMRHKRQERFMDEEILEDIHYNRTFELSDDDNFGFDDTQK